MKKYLVFFLISLAVFLTHSIYTKHAIYGDGNGYYVTAWSMLYDHTFKSPTILGHLKYFQGRSYTFSRIFWDENKNPYSVGTSLFWLPSMAIISLFSPNSLDLLHELGPGITGIILMLSGLYFLEQYLLSFYTPSTVFYTILSLFLGSNLFYYTSLEPGLSHQPAFFLISFLLYICRKIKLSSPHCLFVGFLFGLVHITRIADTFLLIPIIFTLKLDLKKLLLIALGFAIGISPQILAQYYYYGSYARNFYVTESSNQWSFQFVHLFEYLFSLQKGLFVWSPLYLLGLFGLYKLRKKLILVTMFFIWCLGAFWSAHSAMTAGFGQRLALASVPYFGLGLAYCYDKLSRPQQLLSTATFTLWNIFLLYGFYILSWKTLS